jgi:hypothetical protein
MTQLERPWWEQGIYIGGVDEAGRGPLAGPVVAACVVMPEEPLLLDVNDSKKVSEKKREELFELIYKTAKAVGVGIASVEEIEAINIKNAARLAMKRAIEMAQPDRRASAGLGLLTGDVQRLEHGRHAKAVVGVNHSRRGPVFHDLDVGIWIHQLIFQHADIKIEESDAVGIDPAGFGKNHVVGHLSRLYGRQTRRFK